mgnify:CR=1 FL=1
MHCPLPFTDLCRWKRKSFSNQAQLYSSTKALTAAFANRPATPARFLLQGGGGGAHRSVIRIMQVKGENAWRALWLGLVPVKTATHHQTPFCAITLWPLFLPCWRRPEKAIHASLMAELRRCIAFSFVLPELTWEEAQDWWVSHIAPSVSRISLQVRSAMSLIPYNHYYW